MKKGEDMIDWVQKTKSRLAEENVNDATRLRCFRKGLAHEILSISKSLPQTCLVDYQTYLQALENALETSVMKYNMECQLDSLIYTLSEHPLNFITKLKDTLRKTVGPFTDSIFLIILLKHIPEDILSDIHTLGINDDINKITNLLTKRHFDYLKQKALKSNSDKKVTKETNTLPTVNQLLKKSDNKPKVASTSHARTSYISCSYCKKPGHLIKDCRRRLGRHK